MSTLRVNTLQDATGSNQPAMVGAAKAWVNFNGTGTVAIRQAFNVSSITDNGTGLYRVNFTNAMPDANYCITSTNVHQPGIAVWDIACRTDDISTSGLTVQSMDTGNTSVGDSIYLTIAVFR